MRNIPDPSWIGDTDEDYKSFYSLDETLEDDDNTVMGRMTLAAEKASLCFIREGCFECSHVLDTIEWIVRGTVDEEFKPSLHPVAKDVINKILGYGVTEPIDAVDAQRKADLARAKNIFELIQFSRETVYSKWED